MAIRTTVFGSDPDGGGFACYTWDNVTGAVKEVAVGSLTGSDPPTATIKRSGASKNVPDASDNWVATVTGYTVDLPGGGPGNFTTSMTT
jgi:hypothetical protein